MEWLSDNLKQILLGAAGAVLLVLVIKHFAKIKKFILEVRAELKKVSWSTRKELLAATMMVIIITAMLATFIGAIDFVFAETLSRMLTIIK
ncbi:MAG TPA: preprotein translocase subunit SecE [Candidatus Omnitrophica bacterium]|nr:preprotein translocase subunit SecE [Candidatus Omnitrophota bacterium]